MGRAETDAGMVEPANFFSSDVTWRVGVTRSGREPIKSEALANVRFGAHNGLNPDIAPCPKSASSGNTHTPTTELRTEILWKDFPAARHTVSGFAQPATMIEIHCVAVVPA
jgi:hypothetical protein